MNWAKSFWLALSCLALWLSAVFAQDPLWETYMTAGAQAYRQGRYLEAEKSWQEALKEAQRLGPDDLRVATSLNNLAGLYRTQGKYAAAEPLHKRALGILEKALGPEHPDVYSCIGFALELEFLLLMRNSIVRGNTFKANSVSLITCNMVVEHLDHPLDVFREFERILQVGGRVVVHTPNVYSHFVLGSRFLPRRLKLRLIRRLDGREESDAFQTHYRANTLRKLRMLMSRVGLREGKCRMLASDVTLATMHPLLIIPELLYIKLTLRPAFKVLRCSILANFVKAIDERRDEGEQTRRCHA